MIPHLYASKRYNLIIKKIVNDLLIWQIGTEIKFNSAIQKVHDKLNLPYHNLRFPLQQRNLFHDLRFNHVFPLL
jgi:hypothetical protein